VTFSRAGPWSVRSAMLAWNRPNALMASNAGLLPDLDDVDHVTWSFGRNVT
jgi:hypothetical protein